MIYASVARDSMLLQDSVLQYALHVEGPWVYIVARLRPATSSISLPGRAQSGVNYFLLCAACARGKSAMPYRMVILHFMDWLMVLRAAEFFA